MAKSSFFSRVRVDSWISAFIVAASLGFYRMAADYPEQAATYPRGLLVIMAALALAVFLQSLTKPKREPDSRPWSKRPCVWALSVYLMVAAYAAALEPLGFFIPTVLFVTATMIFFGERRLWLMLLLALAFNAFIYVSFIFFLKVPLRMFPLFWQ